MFYVYGHYQHDTGDVFYIGKGRGDRLNSSANRSTFWENVIKKHGYWSDIIAEFENELEALQYEKDAIAFFGRRDLGTGILVNMTEGGDGVSNPSPATREKMAATHRGNTYCVGRLASDETRMKMSTGNKGKHYNEEVRARLLASHLGKPQTAETKAKISLAQKGIPRKPHTAESKAKLSAVLTGKPHKGHNAHRIGVKHSEETKAKMRATWAQKKLDTTLSGSD